jgi:hypothetical protein
MSEGDPDDSTLEPFIDTAARHLLSESSKANPPTFQYLLGPPPPPVRPSKPRRRKPCQPTPEVEAALDLLLQGVPPDDLDPATLRCCLDELSALKKEAAKCKLYVEADRYARLIRISQKAVTVSDFSEQCARKFAYFKEKVADAEAKVAETNEAWLALFRKFEDAVDMRLQDLIQCQQQELEEFDQNRPDGLPSKYNKHSTEYAELRNRESVLARNEEYMNANKVKEDADALEMEELAYQHMKLEDDLERKKCAIFDKHEAQFSAFALWLNARRAEMIRERDHDIQGPLRRLAHYTRIVQQIEERGLPPNPCDGFTTNTVSKKECRKAMRLVAQAFNEGQKEAVKAKPVEEGPIPKVRATSVVRLLNNSHLIVKPKVRR